ncbi:citrate lyase subunit beta/citryl-CoA lyase [Inquilinus ginsengisoli]|uniref:Citrate lyase subunit beta/citryl-CoA lyase n=1 Tax=Inquilinus ginsengisoli TaxID=363840 RepID=A0ABU1K067_9PROT|nr:CoA ester lyase [Inquilinus ginsengisoli]MDR6294262.1 citrate lyase subunit beta/citryl-CoA lyase [Inquilinus ginsengisoli]
MILPRRSLLYVPGANARALEKARTLPADGLILDLEDSVAPEAKAEARDRVVAAAQAGGWSPREVLIRANALDTPWGMDDLAAIATSDADGVVLSKVERPETVREAGAALSAAGAPDSLALWCMIETPLGVLNAAAIAGATPRLAGGRVAGLILGTSDLAKDLRAAHEPGRQPLLTALGLCLLAGRAYGLAVIDGVHLDLEDEAGFAESCRQGAALGFDGKSLIHPKTIAAANTAFAPTVEAVENAHRVIAAHAAALAAGRGVTVVDGRLVEALHVSEAERLVALDRIIAERVRG